MRASRLVQLLLVLQARGRTTAAVLATELEVSERTIHRDVDALSAAGVPIYAERGPGGGIQLVDGYRTRLTGLTGDEAEALFLSGLPGPAAELGLGTVVAAARLKVLAALPTELRARASRLVERFHLDAAGWFHAAEAVPNLAALADAVWESRRIQIAYRRGSSQVERRIEPLGLVLKAGIWYVVAATDGQIRTYRGRRIVAVRDTGETFTRPADFDLPSHWNESIAAYERDVPRLDITVRVDRRSIGLLADMVGERAVREAEVLPDDDDGWRRLRLSVDWPEEVPGRLVALGGAVEIIEPAEVRERAISLAHELIERHALSRTARSRQRRATPATSR
ncbi:MAG TPA: WYL domain-containing protein [Candidatus Limnocylindria bacterium]|nr:WYL domain-containing protein [Candidatus Limnocylindria bacterium]